jgi:hypothetical protein
MKSMHEKDDCHFHNKKKKEYCEEIEFSEEEEESYDSPMNAILNRIETLESVMVQFSEENESHYEIVQSIEHIVKIQRVLIVVHVVLYAYIIHLITDDGENNFIRSLFDYQCIITTVSILKNFILLMATSFYSYLLKNVRLYHQSSASWLSSSLSTEEIENMLMDYDDSFSYNDNSNYYNYSVY